MTYDKLYTRLPEALAWRYPGAIIECELQVEQQFDSDGNVTSEDLIGWTIVRFEHSEHTKPDESEFNAIVEAWLEATTPPNWKEFRRQWRSSTAWRDVAATDIMAATDVLSLLWQAEQRSDLWDEIQETWALLATTKQQRQELNNILAATRLNKLFEISEDGIILRQ